MTSLSNEELSQVTGGRERMTGDTGATKPYTPNRNKYEYRAPQPKLDWGAGSPSLTQAAKVRSESWL